jgi:hypothetical protein
MAGSEEFADSTGGSSLKFRADYLLFLRDANNFMVAETPKNRYLPPHQSKFTEHLLQLVWRNGLYETGGLKTTLGVPVKVLSPGRLNRSSGPDFKNASLIIGDRKIRGEVEIHKDAKEWWDHGHQHSPAYDRVALHVFAERRGDSPAARTSTGREIPELEIGLYLRHQIEKLHEELESAQNPLTGRVDNGAPCRKIIASMRPDDVANLLDLVGDGRMLMKSNRIMDRNENRNPSDTLYETMFECMGYSTFNKQFGRIARRAGLGTISEISKQNPGVPAGLCAQSAYFRLAGKIDDSPNNQDDDFVSSLKRVKIGDMVPMFAEGDWPLAGCRPANYPERRMAAFSLLAASGGDGPSFAGGYAKLLDSLRSDAGEAETRRFVKGLMGHFTSVSDQFWDFHYSLSLQTRARKKLIGRDKAISLVADCLIPFYLAVCRTDNDPKMEHRLVLIYRSLPPPASSGLTDYMTRNMLGIENRGLAKPLRRQQALLQIYKDFCHRAPADCANCAFLEYLKAFRR